MAPADRRCRVAADSGRRSPRSALGAPHRLNVAASLTLEPTARLDPIEIAVDVELQQYRWMIRRPAVASGATPLYPSSAGWSTKTSITRTGLSSPIQSSRHSGNSVLYPRSVSSTKRLIRSSRESYRENHTKRGVFTHGVIPGSSLLRAFRGALENIDPPASSYAIIGGLAPTAERTMDPARIFTESLTARPELENGELDPTPGIREQPGSYATSRRGRLL
jgi:hypothetical protein